MSEGPTWKRLQPVVRQCVNDKTVGEKSQRRRTRKKRFELLKILNRRQPRVPAVIELLGDAVRRESTAVCHGQSTAIGRVLRIGITGNSMCLAAYH